MKNEKIVKKNASHHIKHLTLCFPIRFIMTKVRAFYLGSESENNVLHSVCNMFLMRIPHFSLVFIIIVIYNSDK